MHERALPGEPATISLSNAIENFIYGLEDSSYKNLLVKSLVVVIIMIMFFFSNETEPIDRPTDTRQIRRKVVSSAAPAIGFIYWFSVQKP